MENTKYGVYFNELKKKGLLIVPGSTLIVEIINEELKSKGGLVLSAPSNHARGGIEENRLQVGRVVYTGEGYHNTETGEIDPTDIKVGAVVILPKFSMSLISIFPGIEQPVSDKLGMVKEAQILAYYANEEAYLEAKKLSHAVIGE